MIPKLEIYKDPKKFWAEISPHLKMEEAKNNLILGMSYLFQKDPKDCVYQSALWDSEKFLGALVCSKYLTHQNLLPSPIQDLEHARFLFEGYKSRGEKPTGIVGEQGTVMLYKGHMEGAGWKLQTALEQGIYSCWQVRNPLRQAGVTFRQAEPRDRSVLGNWIEEFRAEAVPFDPPVIGLQMADVKIEKGLVFVLEKDGELVSMAGFSRDIQTSCCINLVYTPKALRSRGYASLVTAQLTQHFLDQGKNEVNLYTDMANPTSNKIYQQIGYKFVAHSIHMAVK